MSKPTTFEEGTATSAIIVSQNTQPIGRYGSKVELGHAWTAVNTIENTNPSTTSNFLIVAANNMHCSINVESDLDIKLRLYEGTSVSSAGTTQTSICMNRQNPGSAGSEFFSSPTTITTGSTLFLFNFFANGNLRGLGTGQDQQPHGTGSHMVLADGTKHLLRVINYSGVTGSATIFLNWYENQ